MTGMPPREWLACPACKGALSDGSPGLVCGQCRLGYPRIGTGWDLRTPRFRGPAEHGDWNLEDFSRAYERLGDYASSAEHSRRSGVPSFVEDYRYPRVKGRLLDWISGANRTGSILDVGCGVGQFLLEVEERLDGRPRLYMGIDVVPVRVRFAQERFAGRDGFVAVLGSAEELPLPDGQMDVVTCSEVLEHVARPGAALAEIARILRPGGLFCLSSPNRTATDLWEGLFEAPRLVRRVVRGTLFRPVSRPYDRPVGARRLLALFQKAGLSIEAFHRSVFLPHESYFQFLPAWVNRTLLAAGSFLERRAPALSPWIGLHYVVRARRLP